jgi:5-(carboxyamino)imidazole ribonucleotide mutase
MPPSPRVAIVMGSDSDLPALEGAREFLRELDVPHETRVVSAHRTPADMMRFARAARGRGLEVIIAGAGGAAHLPGMIASLTTLPVIGVPVDATPLSGLDALLSIVQMPAGVPVATVGIGNSRNAGQLAVRILALRDPELAGRLEAFQAAQARASRRKDARLRSGN